MEGGLGEGGKKHTHRIHTGYTQDTHKHTRAHRGMGQRRRGVFSMAMLKPLKTICSTTSGGRNASATCVYSLDGLGFRVWGLSLGFV